MPIVFFKAIPLMIIPSAMKSLMFLSGTFPMELILRHPGSSTRVAVMPALQRKSMAWSIWLAASPECLALRLPVPDSADQ